MGNLDELEVNTENPTTGEWTATATSHPGFTGTGSNEQEAIEDLKDQIADSEKPTNTNESTEG